MERLAFNVREVAAMVGCSPNTIWAQVHAGNIQHRRIGNRVVIPKWAVNEYLGNPETPSFNLDALMERD